MDRFLMIEAFVRVAETGSFSEAARQIGVANSVISERVKALEAYISSPLFHRSTRNVRLSEVGETYLGECRQMVRDLESLTDQMRGLRSEVRGKLRVQMLPGFGVGHFGKLLTEFSQLHPGLALEVVVNDRVVDPIEEGVDAAFQIFPPSSESLISRSLFPVRRVFCAAPSYLEAHPEIQKPMDLLHHRTALYSGYPTRNKWVFTQGEETVELEIPGAIKSNSVHLLRDFAVSGGGVVCLPTLVASEAMLAGQLQPVLPDYLLSRFDFCAVFPRTQRDAKKVRLIVDFMVEKFGDKTVPSWDEPLLDRGWIRT